MIEELREKIKLHEAAADIADAIIEDNDVTRTIRDLRSENQRILERLAEVQAVLAKGGDK